MYNTLYRLEPHERTKLPWGLLWRAQIKTAQIAYLSHLGNLRVSGVASELGPSMTVVSLERPGPL